MDREIKFMLEAVKCGMDGMSSGKGGPFGCVIVKGNEIVGRGCNSVLAENDPTAHAEVVAIRNACKNLKSFQLEGCEIFTTCEPCPMCMGAIYWARPKIVYFANTKTDAANIGFDDSFIYEELKLPIEKRKMHMEHLHVIEAGEMFAEWQIKENKMPY